MSIRKKFLRDFIDQIKEHLVVGERSVSFNKRDVYLQKDNDLIGLHALGDDTETGFVQYKAWVDLYNNNFEFLASIYQIFGPIEDEVAELKEDGWVDVTILLQQ